MQGIKSYFFSIITPVYNREDCIVRCIESIQNQKFSEYEHIIVDDGSTDDTKEILLKLKEQNNKIRLISYTGNKGVNYARNRALEEAKGEYILFVDSDDYLINDALNIIQQKIKDNPTFTHYLFNVSDRKDDKNLPKECKIYNYNDWLENNISGDFCHVVHKNLLKRFAFFENLRLYESLNWLRILKEGGKQYFIPTFLIIRERDREDSLTKEAYLYHKKAIENEFVYLGKLFELFDEDYKKLANKKYNELTGRYIIYGLALSKYEEINKYLNKANIVYKIIYFLKLGRILKFSLQGYSFIKNKLL